ncbi:TetR/AcrR family transcriptional regulator [Arthrobacter sp. Z1-15]
MPRKIDHATRNSQLIDALWSVIHQQGMSAVSLCTVADSAGVSVGSLRHMFPTRDALLIYAAELMIERVTERIRSVQPSGDSITDATTILMHLVPTDAQSRSEMEINVALVAESGADPNLIKIRAQAKGDLAGLCEALLVRLRPDAPSARVAARARKVHALVDGLAFHLVQSPTDADNQWVEEIIRNELEGWAVRRRTLIGRFWICWWPAGGGRAAMTPIWPTASERCHGIRP